jgi:hypothetical protein
MRQAILIATVGGKLHVASKGKLVPIDIAAVDAAKDEFKKLAASGVHDEIEKLEVWTSSEGRTKRRDFITTKEVKRREEVLKAQDAKAKPAPKA